MHSPVPLHDNDSALMARILGRSRSMFAEDVERHRPHLAQEVQGRRILVIGAAGSIGTAFVRQLVELAPAALHLVDLNENGLVEVVRDLRSGAYPSPADFRTSAIDFGSPEFLGFIQAYGPYDHLVNFSAMKHVRSERDPFGLMRMIQVNVAALHRALDNPAGWRRAFSVSTDKSVSPANLMGATKNLMEQVLFCREDVVASSARFANVAFSAGSLLEGFDNRIAKRQPLAAPTDVKRYFISHQEAGQLCLLAAFLGDHREVFFPALTPDEDLKSFADIAALVLAEQGFEPLPCTTEEEARARMGSMPGKWPCLFAPSDTTGEKPAEEFFRNSDHPDMTRFAALGVVRESGVPRGRIDAFLAEIEAMRSAGLWDKGRIAALLHDYVPDLAHEEKGRDLDQRM